MANQIPPRKLVLIHAKEFLLRFVPGCFHYEVLTSNSHTSAKYVDSAKQDVTLPNHNAVSVLSLASTVYIKDLQMLPDLSQNPKSC